MHPCALRALRRNFGGATLNKNILSLLALSAGLLSSLATAHASPLDANFTLNAGADHYQFTVPANPIPSATNLSCPDSNMGDFCLFNINITKNNHTSAGTIEFFTTAAFGGFEIFQNGVSELSASGGQLFTGTVFAPTISTNPFSFSLMAYVNPPNCAKTSDCRTVNDSGDVGVVPEPSSIAFLSTGLLAAVGTLRRRISR